MSSWMRRNYLDSLAVDYCPPVERRVCVCGAGAGEHELGDFVLAGCERTGCVKFEEAKVAA